MPKDKENPLARAMRELALPPTKFDGVNLRGRELAAWISDQTEMLEGHDYKLSVMRSLLKGQPAKDLNFMCYDEEGGDLLVNARGVAVTTGAPCKAVWDAACEEWKKDYPRLKTKQNKVSEMMALKQDPGGSDSDDDVVETDNSYVVRAKSLWKGCKDEMSEEVAVELAVKGLQYQTRQIYRLKFDKTPSFGEMLRNLTFLEDLVRKEPELEGLFEGPKPRYRGSSERRHLNYTGGGASGGASRGNDDPYKNYGTKIVDWSTVCGNCGGVHRGECRFADGHKPRPGTVWAKRLAIKKEKEKEKPDAARTTVASVNAVGKRMGIHEGDPVKRYVRNCMKDWHKKHSIPYDSASSDSDST